MNPHPANTFDRVYASLNQMPGNRVEYSQQEMRDSLRKLELLQERPSLIRDSSLCLMGTGYTPVAGGISRITWELSKASVSDNMPVRSMNGLPLSEQSVLCAPT